jgi:hypothetical protein
MNPTQSKIQSVVSQFTDEILAIFGDSFASVVADITAATKTFKPAAAPKKVAVKAAAKPAPKPVQKAAAPKKLAAAKPAKPARPGKRVRRSEGQLKADGDKVIKLLGANKKGLRIEQINKMLGTATKALARPIAKLLSDGKIRKQGEKRATTYFPA